MVTNVYGERVPYVGYKDTKVDSELRGMYDSLTRGEQRRLKKESKKLDATKYEYLEEILIDYNNARLLAWEALYGLDLYICFNDLVKLLLEFGIGVQKRRPDEISLISGESAEDIKRDFQRIARDYEDDIVTIYDRVFSDIDKTKDKGNKVMGF